jgi:hypothetical protein
MELFYIQIVAHCKKFLKNKKYSKNRYIVRLSGCSKVSSGGVMPVSGKADAQVLLSDIDHFARFPLYIRTFRT